MSVKAGGCRLALGLALGLCGMLAACSSPSPPAPDPTPTCYPRPEATGEKLIRPTVEATPPAQASPGQAISVVFSGGYVILNNAIICGDTIVRYAYSDELFAYNWDRPIEVNLDKQTLTTVECGYTCQIDVTVPQDILPGLHKLILDTKWEKVIFDLQIIGP